MAQIDVREKLAILADAAKYDASCASSGTAKRSSAGKKDGIGSTEGMGICHAYAPDGRCISLLKILLTNSCIFDCHYCINRKSSERAPRALYTARRWSISRSPSIGATISRGCSCPRASSPRRIIRWSSSSRSRAALREDHGFRGYIHLKTIPDADPLLLEAAGKHADRLSINVELPTVAGLDAQLAPEKSAVRIEGAMAGLRPRSRTGATPRRNIARHRLSRPRGNRRR